MSTRARVAIIVSSAAILAVGIFVGTAAAACRPAEPPCGPLKHDATGLTLPAFQVAALGLASQPVSSQVAATLRLPRVAQEPDRSNYHFAVVCIKQAVCLRR